MKQFKINSKLPQNINAWAWTHIKTRSYNSICALTHGLSERESNDALNTHVSILFL
jgi:hypothetical protein